MHYIIKNKEEFLDKQSDDFIEELQLVFKSGKTDFAELNFSNEFISKLLIQNNGNINECYSNTCYSNNNPIFCLDMRSISNKKIRCLIVDGNHRAYIKVKKQDDFIYEYLISTNLWIHCLATEEEKVFVKILSNINYILNYMVEN